MMMKKIIILVLVLLLFATAIQIFSINSPDEEKVVKKDFGEVYNDYRVKDNFENFIEELNTPPTLKYEVEGYD